MKKLPPLPDSELDIMMILWDAARPMMVSEIHEALQESRPCTKPAVHSLIDRLAQKGYVKIKTAGKPIVYKLITPKVKKADYTGEAANGFIQRFFGGSKSRLIASLIDGGGLSKDELKELSRIIDSKEQGGDE